MHITRRGIGAAMGLASPGPAWAQSALIRIVVGFPPGGPLDISARLIAPHLAAALGVPVPVENRVGASGNHATRDVAHAVPDGRTLLLMGPVQPINTVLLPDPAFDFARDILPVAGMARVPLILEVNPAVPARSLPELIALARAEPGRLRVAYAGRGTPQHVAIELFQHMAGIRLRLQPYPGSADALADLLRGEADVMFDPAPSSMPHIRAGRLIPLATTGPDRAAALPEVPYVAEVLAGYEAGSWFGLGAPRETPEGVIARLNTAVNAALAQPEVAAAFERLGGTLMPGTAADFAAFVAAETRRYTEIIRLAGIRPH